MNSKFSESTHLLSNDSPYGVFDNLLEGCQIIDPDWRYFYVNDTVAEHARLQKEQLLGRTMMEAFPGIEDTPVFSILRQCMKDGKPHHMENEFTFQDGSKGWYDLRFLPVPEGVMIFSLDITERKQIEMELRLTRDHLEMFLQGADLGTWDWNFQTGEAAFSERWGEMSGYTLDEIDPLIRSWEKLVHPNDMPGVMGPLNAHLNGEIPDYKAEYRLRHKSGEWIWVLDKGRVIERDADGKPLRMSGTLMDITEYKRAEAKLRESKRILDATGKIGKIGGWVHELDSGKAFWTEALYDIVEIPYDQEPPSVEEHLSYYPPQDRKILEQAYSRTIKSGIPFDIELQGHTSKKKPIWCRAQGEPVYEDGKCVAVRGTFQDITGRKQAEEERDRLQAQLSNALEMAHLGHWEYDVAKDLFTFNDHFYKIFRTSAKEVGGYRMSSAEYARRFVHPDDMPVVGEEIRKAIEEPAPNFRRQLEHRMIYTDGTVGHISVQFFIVTDDRGKTVKTYGVNQDITERKRMEEELLRVHKLESVGILAGGIAHDFNNILTAILGNVTMAKMEARPGDVIFDLLSEAETASRRAQALTRQLLTFAKGGAPVKETASIGDIVKESSLFVLRGSNSGIEFSMAEGLWPAEVDAGQISQVINNIVINASQAMPEGGRIQVAGENLTIDDRHGLPLKPGRYIRISIQDQGVGITEKHLSKVFDPYFTTKHEGSGLGLATTYSIIKRHDGHITVESNLGEGATFHIYLPASEKSVPENGGAKVIKGGGRILVMDDEAPLRKMLGKMLEKLGYEPDFAEDGAEALERYKASWESGRPYDAVILDLTVPGGMGGKEVIDKMLETYPGTKALVSSGYSDDPVLANFQEYGFQGKLPKPFGSRSLGKVLHEVLNIEKE